MHELWRGIRPAPCWLFVIVLAASLLMSVLGNQVFVPSGVWRPIQHRMHGLVNVTLLWGIAYSIVVIGGVLWGVGKRKPHELGLKPRDLPSAVIGTCIVWIIVQAILAVCYLFFERPVVIANGWDGDYLGKTGGLLGQLFGNALCEEIIFRGFLFVQCILLFRSLWPQSPRSAYLVGFAIAAGVFAVFHLPFDLRPDRFVDLKKLFTDQAEHLFFGCLFCWIFWRTRNLFFTVGVHALANEPTTLFAWHNLGPLTRADPVVLVVGMVVAASWERVSALKNVSNEEF